MILASHGIIGSQILQATGLLIEYPGAAAAYSLRLLRSTYTGSAIRVRRSSDNTEQDIGFVSGELDTSSLLSFVGTGGTDNGFVKTWYDQSGNGYDAEQTTIANQPQIVSSGSVILENAKPIIQFDGVDDSLDNTIYSQVSSTGLSAFLVQQSTPSLNAITIGFGYDAPTSKGALLNANRFRASPFLDYQTAGFEGRFDSTNNYINGARSGTSTTNQFLLTAITDGVNNTGFADGLQQGQVSISTPYDFASGLYIGKLLVGSFGNFNAQEFIIYNSDQSSNRTGIETNINDFYSIY